MIFFASNFGETDIAIVVGAHGVEMAPYDFQFEDRGKEFLIMSPGAATPDELLVRQSLVWPAAKSQALMAAFDQEL
jgi:hypothetical protein